MVEKRGIILDLGCGGYKQEFIGNAVIVGIDKRDVPGVDIVHDLEVFPWPVEDNSCISVIASHIIEHIKPWFTIQFMDEIWRVTKPGGRLAMVAPYGVGFAYVQDPTHCNPVNEAFFQYFDPSFDLYHIYNPKPWKCIKGYPRWTEEQVIEFLLEKVL